MSVDSDQIPDQFFEKVAEEFSNDSRDEGLWLKAFSKCGGNEEQTKATYILLRATKLWKDFEDKQQQTSQILRAQKINEAKQKSEEQAKQKILEQKKAKEQAEIQKAKAREKERVERLQREAEKKRHHEEQKIKRLEAEKRIAERTRKAEERKRQEDQTSENNSQSKRVSSQSSQNKTGQRSSNFLMATWPWITAILLIATAANLSINSKQKTPNQPSSSISENKNKVSQTTHTQEPANAKKAKWLATKWYAVLHCDFSNKQQTTFGWLSFSNPSYLSKESITTFEASFNPKNTNDQWQGSMYINNRQEMKMAIFTPNNEPLSFVASNGIENNKIKFSNTQCIMTVSLDG